MRRFLLAPVPLLLAAVLAGCAAPEEAAEGDVPLGTGGFEQVVFDGRLYQCEDSGHADTLCRLFVPAEDQEATVEDAPEASVRPDGTALLNGRVYVCGDAEERPHVVSETNQSALDGEASPGGTSGECPAWRLSA